MRPAALRADPHVARAVLGKRSRFNVNQTVCVPVTLDERPLARRRRSEDAQPKTRAYPEPARGSRKQGDDPVVNQAVPGGVEACDDALTAFSLLSLSTVRAAEDSDELKSRPGNVKARGSFTCDFGLPGNMPLELVAPVIEHDRMYMAERPGMQHKQIPLRFDFATGNLLSGGRYLFDSKQDAVNYKAWVENDFILDGTRFFDRPIFLSPDCHAWGVIGAHNFQDFPQQVIVRTERWSVPHQSQMQALKQAFPAIMAAAQQRGLTAVWLLYNKQEQLAQIVYFADRIVPQNPLMPDFASLGALESAAPLGAIFDNKPGWTKTFDRTQWVLTVWFPFELGDHGLPALWPNSPPLPEAYPGDGVCEVSRGENSANAPGDCAPTAGNGVCDAGENTQNTPGDCRLP